MLPRERSNAAYNAVGETLWGFQAALVAPATVLTLLLQQNGAGKQTIGALAAIGSGLSLLPQVLSIYLFTSHRKRKRHLLLWHFFLMIPFTFLTGVLVHFSGSMSQSALRFGLIALFACFQFSMGMVVAVWLDWLAHLFRPEIRGKVVGLSWCCSALAGSGGALLAGHLIRSCPVPQIYAWLYLAAGAMQVFSVSVFWFIKDPAADEPDIPPISASKLLLRFRESLGNENFRSFLAGRSLAMIGFSITPFIAVYYTSQAGGGLSPDMVVSYGAAMAIGLAIGNLVLGWLGDRAGHRAGLLIGAGIEVITLGIMLTSAGRLSCQLAYAGAGVAGASGFVSHNSMIFETCPHDSRLAHIMVANLILGLVAVAAPSLGGAAAAAWGLRTLFAICLVFSFASLAWVILRVREPRGLAAQPAR